MKGLFQYYTSITTDAGKGFQLFSVCRQAVAFIVGVFLAKSVLTLDDIGTYEIWIYLGLLLSLVALSGSLQAFLTTFPKIKIAQRGGVVFTTFLFCWLATVAIAAAIYFFRELLFESILQIAVIPNLGWVLFFLVLHLNAALIPHIFLVHDRARAFVPFCLFYTISGILSVGLPLWLGGGLSYLLSGLIVWSILEQLYLICTVLKFGQTQINLIFLKTFIVTAIPLTVYAGSGMMAQVFDAWLVNNTFSSLPIFAIFKYGAREMPGALALSSAFSAAMIVVYAREGNIGLARIKEGSRRFMHFFFPLSLALMLFSRPLFKLIYEVRFVESAMIFNTYLLIMASRWIFPQAVLIGMDKHSDVLKISLLELVTNIILSLILVRYFGLVGIALGTTLAFYLEKIIMVCRLTFKYKINSVDYIPVKALLVYSVLLLITYLVAWL